MSGMLKAENVTVRYGARTVVQDLSFELKEGEWLMLVGPNGAGKSTLIEAIAGGVPYAGKITLAGRNIRAFRASELARRIGVLKLNVPKKVEQPKVEESHYIDIQ